MTKNKSFSIFVLLLMLCFSVQSQNNIFNPYSRYGLGELNSNTLAHNNGMGGASVALKPDSTMPLFINTGNPSAYPLIKLTTLEVGGSYLYSNFKSSAGKSKNWGTNFSYATLGFPIRRNGGAAIGIMPYSNIGYDVESKNIENNIGTVTYQYNGSGNLNKAFIGYGIMPFDKRLTRFRSKHQYIADSLKHLSKTAFRFREFGSKILSDFSIGANINYLFGNVSNNTKVIYPNSLLYNNTLRERSFALGDFTGNFKLPHIMIAI